MYIIHPSGTLTLVIYMEQMCQQWGWGLQEGRLKGRKGWMDGWMMDRKHFFFHWIPAP